MKLREARVHQLHSDGIEPFMKLGGKGDTLMCWEGNCIVAEWLDNDHLITRLYRLPEDHLLWSRSTVTLAFDHYMRRDAWIFHLESDQENLSLAEAQLLIATKGI